MNGSNTGPGSPEILVQSLEADHCDEPVGVGEISRLGPARSLPGVELLYGSYRRFSFARHFHSVPAIGLVETGIMRTCGRRSTHCAPAGTVILLNPGDVHAPQPADGAGWSFRMLYLDDSLLREIALRSGEHRPIWFMQSLVENAALYSAMLALLRRLDHEPDALAAECRLLSVLQQVARYSQWRDEPHLLPAQSKVDRVRDYLHAHSTGPLTLRTLSDVAELSPWHLLRSFQARFGITPHAYQMQARVERGRTLLGSGVSITETALMTGFVDQSHFTRQFKRYTGVTPGQYSPVNAPRRQTDSATLSARPTTTVRK